MKKEWSEEELKEIAKQLSNPDGPEGVKTGERMSHGNGMMIHSAISVLDIKPSDNILEIGPGNGGHIHSIFEIGDNIRYQGVDISATMVDEANEINQTFIQEGRASFSLSDGNNLDFADDTFDKIFTVNTVYFWQDPLAYATEIYRVLKPGGIFGLVFSDSDFMEKLPFTKFGFQLYNKDSGEELLRKAKFGIYKIIEDNELTTSNLGEEVERPVVIILAKK